MLAITVGAPVERRAVQRASAVATAFLQFRGEYAQTQQQQLADRARPAGTTQAQQNLNSINRQISQVSAEPSSSALQAKLNNLQRSAASSNALAQIEQYVTGTLATAQTTTTR